MDRDRLSSIGHSRLRFAHPVGEEKMNRLADLTPARRHRSVLDIGAGECEFLRRRIRRHGVPAAGVEIRPDVAPPSRGRLRIVIADARRYSPAREFDVAACIGSTHALGGDVPALCALIRGVRPGGFVGAGEGSWMRRPSPGYLRALKARRRELGTQEENILRAESLGLTPWWSAVAGPDAWDDSEWSYLSAVEAFAGEHPGDPEVPDLLRHIRASRRARMKWGRDTLGFALYLFRTPPI